MLFPRSSPARVSRHEWVGRHAWTWFAFLRGEETDKCVCCSFESSMMGGGGEKKEEEGELNRYC